MRKRWNCVVLLGPIMALAGSSLPAGADEHLCRTLGDVPILSELPKTPAEYVRRMQAEPSMAGFARDGETINGGLQIVALGDQVPLGPAPHTDWARPLAGGRLRVIVISPTAYSFDTAEVQRRLDADVRHIHLPDQYGACKQYPEALAGFFSAEALRVLRSEADVILADPSVRFLSPAVAEAIAKKVEGGCGLVLLGVARWGGGGAYGYWLADSPIETWQRLGKQLLRSVDGGGGKHHYLEAHKVVSPEGLLDGIPFELLPAHNLVRMEPADGVRVLARDGELPMVLGARVGRGRIALAAWASYMGGFPFAEDNRVPRVRQYQDYYAAAMIRILLWAADRPSSCTVTIDNRPLTAAEPQQVMLHAGGAAGRLDVRLRDLLCRDVLQTSLVPAAGSVALKLPALAGGTYLLDAIARDAHGASLGWASFVLKIEAPAALRVLLDRETYAPGQPVRVTARTEGPPVMGCSAELRVWDALGRLLLAEEQPLVDGRAQWTYPNRDPLSVLHFAEVEVRRGAAPWLSARAELFVPRWDFTDFHNCLWGGWLPPYAIDRIDRRLRENLGFDVMLCGGYGGTQRAGNFLHLAAGELPFYTNVAAVDPQAVEQAPLATKAATLESADGIGDELHKFGAAVVFFQDERHGMTDSGKLTPEALTEFRTWLRPRYHDLDDLNRVWGSNFRNFDEVTPALTRSFDPRRQPSLAAWLEWRQWAAAAMVDIDRTVAARIRQAAGHDCWMGLEGIFGLAEHNIPYGGLDLAAQAENCFNAAAPYNENLMNACQSFYAGPSFCWGGYGTPYSAYQRYVWARALQGDWSLGWFCGATYYTAYDDFFPQAQWLADLTRPLREGLGKLLMENRPVIREPIAFLYSQPSLYGMAILGKTVAPQNDHLFVRPADWARDSLQRMFFDAGVQFSYVSEKQLQAGRARGIKLLVLTSCVALAPATCRALEQFVADGGIVLADVCPGAWDDRGGYHAPGQLDRLFGVKHEGRLAFDVLPEDWSIGISQSEPGLDLVGQWFIGQYFEKSLKVDGGHALGRHIFGPDKPPAFVYHRAGKGATLLTNYLETEYRRVPEQSQRSLAQAVLKLAGIRPAVTLRARSAGGEIIDGGLKVTRWQDGAAEYVGLILDTGQDVTVELPRAAHLYELSAGGKYLGRQAAASLDLRETPHALLALLPYRVERVSLTAGPARLGQELPLDFRLLVSHGQPVKHVVHLDVYRPDGSRHYSYSRNFAFQAGRWTGGVPLALNDPAGKWTIRARDVTSGMTAETVAEVRP